jgi:hypothetical protein
MHRNPVKRALAEKPEQWEWSSFRSYLLGETGPVSVKFQEWPTELKGRPVVTFGDGNGASILLARTRPPVCHTDKSVSDARTCFCDSEESAEPIRGSKCVLLSPARLPCLLRNLRVH